MKCLMLALGALLVMTWVGGCKAPGTEMVSYSKGTGEMIVAEAPVDGEYVLYKGRDVVMAFPLKKGEKIGFEKAETGKVNVVAGDRRKELPDASYTWVRR